MEKDRQVNTRFTTAERELLESAAAKSDKKMSIYMHDVVLADARVLMKKDNDNG